MSETINWIDATKELPDDEIDVLVRSTSGSVPVWVGSREDDRWFWSDGSQLHSDVIVTHWADMPAGPEVES